MGSLLAIKHWKGKFKTVAGINPDYSYGRNNFAAFQALLKKFGIEHKVVADQWPKVGTLDLTSHVAALKAAKPDLVFSSLLFADLPIFMKHRARRGPDGRQDQVRLPGRGLPAHAAEEGVHAGGHDLRPQHALLRLRQRRRRCRSSSCRSTRTSTRTTRTGKPTAPTSRWRSTRPASRRRYKAKNALAGQGRRHQRDGRREGRVARRPGPDAQGPHRRADLLPGHHDAQEQVRLPDARHAST